MLTHKYMAHLGNGDDVWMVCDIVVCSCCKRGSVAHDTARRCTEDFRATFAFLDRNRLPTAVRSKGEWICWDCQDAIYRPEPDTKVANRRDSSD